MRIPLRGIAAMLDSPPMKQRDHVLFVKATREEALAVARAADELGLSKSSYVRRALRIAARDPRVRSQVRHEAEVVAAG